SPDGLAWTVRHSAASAVSLTKMQTQLYAGKYTATTPTMAAIFDNYRAEPNPTPPVIVRDDFDDNAMDAAKWYVGGDAGVAVAEQGGQLRVTTPGGTATGYGGFHARSNFDLTNSRATVEMVQAAVGHGTETYFLLADKATGGTTHIFFGAGGENGLIMRETFNGVIQSQTLITYDPAQHRFWRFRHDQTADTLNWETSPDGLAWTVRHVSARRVALTQMQAQLYAGRYTTYTPSKVVVFDNFIAERLKPLHAPSDDFNDNLLDAARWTPAGPVDGPTSVREQNQRLEVALTPNAAGYNGVSSAAAFNFWNKSLQVEVPQVASTAGWVETAFELKLDNNNSYLIDVGAQGSFVFDALTNGVRDRTVITYNAAQHRFWRFRHNAAAHTMNFEVSGDGRAWTTIKTVKVNFSLEAVRAWAFAGAWGTGNASPGAAYFDNLRLESNE
ncbi:MAG TPA: hypothetical protein VEQ42_02830, partial [Pyrinomonadaceae bacterium]|nr:hypothetical protein [Pyrinomonadaceae bacterium]